MKQISTAVRTLMMVLLLTFAAVPAMAASEEPIEETTIQPGTSAQLRYATGFSIDYLEDGIKRLIDGEGREVILVPREIETIPAEFEGKQIVRTPVERVMYSSNPMVGMLMLLDEDWVLDSICAVTTKESIWTFDEIVERMQNGQIAYVGNNSNGDPDYEQVQEINPELVFVRTGAYAQTTFIEKLEELGIPYVVDNGNEEQHYLGRKECVRFSAAFYNLDQKALDIMNQAEKDMEELREKLADVTVEDSPSLVWCSPYNGMMSMTEADSWEGSMMQEVKANNLFADIYTGNNKLTIEEVYARAYDADLMIYGSTPNYTANKKEMLENVPQFEDLKLVQDGNIWQIAKSFYQSNHMTDVMAKDLAAILYPDLFPDYEPTYFIKMADE